MTFVRAWVLLFTLIPLAWLAYEWRRTARKLAMGLKAGSLILVICALSEPRFNFNDTKVAVAALVDTSASVSSQDLTAASELINRMEKKRGSNVLQVIPFAKATRNPSAQELASGWKFSRTAGENGRGTGQSGTRRPRRHCVAPFRHDSPRGSDLRRPRKSWHGDPRHMAGSAVRHPDRYRRDGGPSKTQPAHGIRFVPVGGLQRREISDRSDHYRAPQNSRDH